jgi:hypothetical protein
MTLVRPAVLRVGQWPQRKIERDLGEKVMAIGLDASAFASADGAATPYYAPPSTVGTPMTMGKWVKNTHEMCALAQRVVENGQRLRHLCGLKVEEHTLSVQKVVKQVLKEIRYVSILPVPLIHLRRRRRRRRMLSHLSLGPSRRQ